MGRFVLVTWLVLLCGCVEVEERVQVHADGSSSYKGTVKVDPQYEAMVLPKLKQQITKDLPPGARVDFSQRIDGKAAVIIEAEGEAAARVQGDDLKISVNPAGFMKQRYLFKGVVNSTPDYPVPHRKIVTFPGSIEKVVNGKKISSDTAEFDLSSARRGTVYGATSTAFAFSFGGGGRATSENPNSNPPSWLIPGSVGLALVGLAMLITGWFRKRQRSSINAAEVSPTVAIATLDANAQGLSPSTMFCTECGAQNVLGRNFCSQCGHPLE